MPAAEPPPLLADPDFCVLSRRNNSLATGARWTVFAALAAVSLTLALAFAAVGAWPVLPYAVLEIAVLACAFAWVERRAGDWERLTVAGDRVIVERAIAGRRSQREFNRPWLRLEVEAGGWLRPRQIMLRCSGEAIGFGAELPAAERVAVARELARLVRRA
jgi:uncharacterized membrane protein